ncbi:MAG: FAD-dependent oxidoreductase [Deltaproteobacteria bacterium]|nr:FAD-dependent oxidoreductase [Deltaproteobacteria bacterium]
MQSSKEPRIVLLGIGHTNAHVLDLWRREPIAGARLVCVSSFAASTYSGMLPGTLSGQYPPGRLEIDLRSLAQAARAELVVEPALGVDVEARTVLFEKHEPVPYDILSVGAGSVPNRAGIDADPGTWVPIKPMQTFLMRLYERLQEIAPQNGGELRVLVIGGGVGGIEISLCLPSYLHRVLGEVRHAITIVDAGERIGGGLSPRALPRAEALLEARGVEVITGARVTRVDAHETVCADGRRIPADLVILAAGAAPPPVLENTALPKDARGFLLTRETLQSTGSESVFAVGDSGTMANAAVPKAGVYAVRQGPVLWRNIGALARGEPLSPYEPQHDFLRLLNTGDGKALMDYKGWSAHARWCWRFKDYLDSRFMARFRVIRR